MSIQEIKLELIVDNPYQARSSYPRTKIEELAHSIKEIGLRQIPEARKAGAAYQLAYGHLRFRAFKKLAKESPKKWTAMPLDVKELTDEQMFLYSWEENQRRHDITPMDQARAIEKYLTDFPKTSENELAKKLTMTQGAISNMRRVLKLPDLMLEKIDAGIINFTMGRELLPLADLEGARELMSEVVAGLKFENKASGEPCTVEGIQRSIHSVCRSHLKPLTSEYSYYGAKPDFDVKTCDKCEKVIITHPEKKQTGAFCKDSKCWTEKQEQHRKATSELAIKQMKADLAKKVAAEAATPKLISQEIPAGLPEGIRMASAVPKEECANCNLSATDHTAGLKYPNKDGSYSHICAKDYAAWEKRNAEQLADQAVDKMNQNLRKVAEEAEAGLEEDEQTGPDETPPAPQAIDVSPSAPVDTQTVEAVTDRIKKTPARKEATAAVVTEEAKEQAGTRAQVLDLKELRSGHYGDLKAGHVMLKDRYGVKELQYLDDPEECTERCTRGFHYAYDSGYREDIYGKEGTKAVLFVCTDPKCVTQKKSALTRKKNAEGNARKKAEAKAIKEAIEVTTAIGRPQMKLIIQAQVAGDHIKSGYNFSSGEKTPGRWLWEKLSAGVPEDKRTEGSLEKVIDKQTDQELAQLIVEMSFYYLVDKSEPIHYKIKNVETLKWFDIDVVEEAKEA